MKPFVSVIITTYNRLHFLKQAVASVFMQTYDNLELIIVDDGSEDGTHEWILGMSQSSIKYISLKHQGLEKLSCTFNQGLQAARGNYVVLLDSDDVFSSATAILDLVTTIDTTGSMLAFSAASLIDENGDNIPDLYGAFSLPYNTSLRLENKTRSEMLEELFKHCFIPSSGVILHRVNLLNLGGFRSFGQFFGQDYATWITIAMSGTISYCAKSLVSIRKHRENSSGSMNSLRSSLGSLDLVTHYFPDAVTAGLLQTEAWKDIATFRQRAIASACWNLNQQFARNRTWDKMTYLAHIQWNYGNWSMKIQAVISIFSGLLRIDLINPPLRIARHLNLELYKESRTHR